MSTFIDEYAKLLIKQYYNKAKARAEIELKIGEYEKLYNIINTFPDEFDIDLAYGDRLDLIGKIVGVTRSVGEVVDKIGFGFEENLNARGFADKYNALDSSAPFVEKFTPNYTDLQLDDPTFRLIIKAKIAVNNASAYMVSDERISVQQVIQSAFQNRAWVVDRYDMSIDLYISPTYEGQYLRLINNLNLLPKPQGVRYNQIVSAERTQTFGFDDNEYALGFGDKFGDSDGYFASKVIL